MNKENLLQLTGNRLSCASNCPHEFQCFGGWVNENSECEEGINKLKKIFNDLNYINLLMTQGFFGLRVFDSFSEKKPLPVIGTILIEKGNLSLRKE
jgi:hypothetical protein